MGRRSPRPGEPGSSATRSDRPRRGRPARRGGWPGWPGWSANPSSVGSPNGATLVRADPPPDVAVGDRLEIVGPGKAHQPAIGGHRAALVPVPDPAGRVRHDGDRLRPGHALVVRPEVDDPLEPPRIVEVRLVRLDAQQQPPAREAEERVGQAGRADIGGHRDDPPRRPRLAAVGRIGQQDRHRQAAFGLRVEQRLAGERLAVDPQADHDQAIAVEPRDRVRT